MDIEKLRRIYEYANNKIGEYYDEYVNIDSKIVCVKKYLYVVNCVYHEYSSYYDSDEDENKTDEDSEETRKNSKKKERLETRIKPHQKTNNINNKGNDIEQVIDIFKINMHTDDIKCYRYIDTIPCQHGYSVDLIENKIVLCGGIISGSSPVFSYSHNEIYHIDLDTMKCIHKKSQKLKPYYDHLTTSRYNYIYKFGGRENYYHSHINKDILRYDIILDEWSYISQLNTLNIYKQINNTEYDSYNIKIFSLSFHHDNLVLVGFNFVTNRIELYYFNFSTSLWNFVPTNIPIISCFSIIKPSLQSAHQQRRYWMMRIKDICITIHNNNIYIYFSEGNCEVNNNNNENNENNGIIDNNENNQNIENNENNQNIENNGIIDIDNENNENKFYTGISRRYAIDTKNFHVSMITSMPILYGTYIINRNCISDISFIQTHFPSIFNTEDYVLTYISVLTCIFTHDVKPYIIGEYLYDMDIICLI